jgi:peptidylprolyl isomerase
MKTALTALLVVAVATSFFFGCSKAPRQAAEGDTVKVDYTGKLDDGTIFDSSEGREPLQFTIGGGQMIAGFDEGVRGMTVGETKTITLTPDQAYGEHTDDRIIRVGKSAFPPDMELTEGMQLQSPTGMPVTVLKVDADSVTIDANHPLAGKTLSFDVTLVEIIPPGEKPAETGQNPATQPPTDQGQQPDQGQDQGEQQPEQGADEG